MSPPAVSRHDTMTHSAVHCGTGYSHETATLPVVTGTVTGEFGWANAAIGR